MRNKLIPFAFSFLLFLNIVSAGVYTIQGKISNSSLSIYPPYYLEYNESTEFPESNYSMNFYDSEEVLLKQYKFPAGKSLYTYEDETRYFLFYVSFPENTSKVVFKEDIIDIGEFLISQNAPVINWVNLTCDSLCHASWNATDADEDFLIYDISYYDNGWNYLAFDLGANYLDFNENATRIKIRASDGFNFAESEANVNNLVAGAGMNSAGESTINSESGTSVSQEGGSSGSSISGNVVSSQPAISGTEQVSGSQSEKIEKKTGKKNFNLVEFLEKIIEKVKKILR